MCVCATELCVRNRNFEVAEMGRNFVRSRRSKKIPNRESEIFHLRATSIFDFCRQTPNNNNSNKNNYYLTPNYDI